MLSLPDDWRIYESELVNHGSDGISSLRSGVKELIDNGYIKRIQLRNDKGHFIGYEYDVYEVSTEIRKSDNGNSKNGKSNTTNNDLTNNKYKVYNGGSIAPRNIGYDFQILYKQIDKIFEEQYEDGCIGNLTIEDIKKLFAMFYEIGKHRRGIKPSRLKNNQVRKIIESIYCIGDEEFEPSLEDYRLIIEDYFRQDFPDCDYGINHFVSGDIILMRCYNLREVLEF